MDPNRRSLLQAGCSAPLLAAPLTTTLLAQASKTRRVDAHLHCFAGAQDRRFPYHSRAPYQPNQAATPEHLLMCMDGAGVDFAVVVHPEPYQDDHRYLAHCLRIGSRRLKGTLLLFADRPDSVKQLPKLVRDLDVVSVRIHAYAPDRLPPFGKRELRHLWKMAAEHGLAVQLHFEPRYAPGFEPLIREFRDTTVIIDHLGRPLQGTPKEHEVVVRWARFENTVMKLSSLASSRNYPHRDIRPIVQQLVMAFGAERMIYGGGLNASATPDSYRAAFDRGETFVDQLSTADRAKIFGENAVRLFGFA